MTKIYAALTASALLSLGCVPPTLVVPSQSIPHQVAADTEAIILVEHPNGQVERQKVRVPAGWWVASAALVGTPKELSPAGGGKPTEGTPPKPR